MENPASTMQLILTGGLAAVGAYLVWWITQQWPRLLERLFLRFEALDDKQATRDAIHQSEARELAAITAAEARELAAMTAAEVRALASATALAAREVASAAAAEVRALAATTAAEVRSLREEMVRYQLLSGKPN